MGVSFLEENPECSGRAFDKFHITDVLEGIEENRLWNTTDISNSEFFRSISEDLDSMKRSFQNLFYLYLPFRVYLVHLKGFQYVHN